MTPNQDQSLSSSEELLPCPFCGCDAESEYAMQDRNAHGVYCINCEASMDGFDFQEDAVKAWNSQPIITKLQEEVEELQNQSDSFANKWIESVQKSAKAIGYASRLFNQLAPQCTPEKTMIGLILQLDNFIAGQKEDLTETYSLNEDQAKMLEQLESQIQKLTQELEGAKNQLRFIRESTCDIHPFSSRTCDFGTRCCDVMHIPKATDTVPTRETVTDTNKVSSPTPTQEKE